MGVLFSFCGQQHGQHHGPRKLQQCPSSPSTAGSDTEFKDPYSLSPAFVVTAASSFLLASCAVAVRLVVSFYGLTKRVRVEDYTPLDD